MKISTDAKHSTDKKAEKFWDEVHTKYEEYVVTANKMNVKYQFHSNRVWPGK